MRFTSLGCRARAWRTRAFVVALATLSVAVMMLAPIGAAGQALSPLEQLGKFLFFDTNLSTPPGQSCAACHAPEVGFTGPVSHINAGGGVYPGAVANRFGNRKPPASAYAGDSPVFHFDAAEELFIGGMFWDGRATGWTLGDPLAEQARGPFLNPLEQNMPSAKQVVTVVSHSDYAGLFVQVWGPGSLDPLKDVAGSYIRIARSIAAYERSAEVNPFSSKYDYYLKGQARLTRQERDGLRLYEGKAMCAACHPSSPGPNGEPPVFTDFTYDNLGIPKNPANPFYSAPASVNPSGADWVDPGLGGFLKAHAEYGAQVEANWGKHKVPTLRNVDLRPDPGLVKAFGHNAYFKSLEDIVHFYNTRDVAPWPEPEVAMNVNTDELGDLGLTPDEELAVVAFLKTLSDGYVLTAADRAGDAPSEVGSAPGLTTFDLVAIRPSPARTSATITFALPAAARVVLSVYDLGGRRVIDLAGSFGPGRNSLVWDGRDRSGALVTNGAYFCRLTAGDVTRVGKVLWLR